MRTVILRKPHRARKPAGRMTVEERAREIAIMTGIKKKVVLAQMRQEALSRVYPNGGITGGSPKG